MTADAIVGSWELLSVYGESVESERFYPYGEDPVSMLTYTLQGYMSAVLMRSGRTDIATGDLLDTTAEELREAVESFDAYCGRYTLEPERGAVIHHVQARRVPNGTGTDQVHYAELVDDMLEITTDPVRAGGRDWVVHVLWRALTERSQGRGRVG